MRTQALHQLESLLQARKLDGTLARRWEVPPACAATGIAALDGVLEGGWRRGEVSELTGSPSSGRTSVLVASLAAATGRGEVVGLVDAFDRFDPAAAAAAGLDLARMLWVRGWGLPATAIRRPATPAGSVEAAIQRAVRACDLLVRAGGFGIVALDLADVPSRPLQALPWTTWKRLAHATEGRDTVVLLLGDAPLGRSARGVSVQLAATPVWSGASAQSRRFATLEIDATLLAGPAVFRARSASPLRFEIS